MKVMMQTNSAFGGPLFLFSHFHPGTLLGRKVLIFYDEMMSEFSPSLISLSGHSWCLKFLNDPIMKALQRVHYIIQSFSKYVAFPFWKQNALLNLYEFSIERENKNRA